MDKKTVDALVERAVEARKKSYCPYSGFAVGAALLSEDGKCYTGANVENASFTPTICAERVAFFQAVHEGKRKFSAIAIVGGKADEALSSFCAPCGVCRQVMSEFCDGDFIIVTANRDRTKVDVSTFEQLLPHSFGPKDLGV